MNEKENNTYVKFLAVGAVLGFAAGVASANKIKEMVPKLIALSANQYVNDRAHEWKKKLVDVWNATTGGATSIKDNVLNRTRHLGENIAAGTHDLGENIAEGAKTVKDKTIPLFHHDQEQQSG